MSDEEDERPSFGGGGGGLGFSRGGLAANFMSMGQQQTNDQGEEETGYESPRKRPRLDGGFRKAAPPAANAPKTKPGGAFAARMMASMGWREGEGLGTKGHGRLAPIDITLRPQGAGLGAVKEKSKQAKQEEHRAAALRGDVLEDSSDEERKRKKAAREARRKAGGTAATHASRPRKPKYVTAEEVKADLEGLDVPENVLKAVYDLTGKQTEDWGSKGGFVAAQAASDPAEIEAQKAAKLIHRELLACAETRHGLNDQRAYLDDATSNLVDHIDQAREDVRISKDLVAAIESLPTSNGQEMAAPELSDTITDLTKRLESLEVNHRDHLDRFDLPEVAVALLHPLFRAAMQEWDPVREPAYLTDHLDKLKALLGIHDAAAPSALTRDSDLHSEGYRSKRSTTHYETMIYQLWLPCVRSAITNEFAPEKPQPFVELVSAWRALLPMFVYSNVLNQLIVPRLASAVRDWRPSRSSKHRRPSPDEIIFPWLPYLSEHQLDASDSDSLMSEVRRKLRSQLGSLDLKSGVPTWLKTWRSLLGSAYTHLLTNHLLPRLAAYLSQHLVIDPADQDLSAFDTVLAFAPLFSASTVAQLLIAEFFPKIHAALHAWLARGGADFAEIRAWSGWWREQLPAPARDAPQLAAQWHKAHALMGAAHDLGGDVAGLAPPFPPAVGRRKTPEKAEQPPAERREPTFKDVVEEWCAENDLVFVAQREAHAQLREPLFRISASADQKSGAVVYMRHDVLFAEDRARDGGAWRPTALDAKLVIRAGGR